jgi:protocatechuate 4,5-dioxygenase alpha chain
MDLSRTTVFTGEMSRKGYRLNRLAMSLTDAANRERYRAGEEAYLRAAGLTAEEREMVLRRDWKGLIESGGSIYLMIKIAGTVGQSLLDVGAHTKGETAQQFLAARGKGH